VRPLCDHLEAELLVRPLRRVVADEDRDLGDGEAKGPKKGT
jgi:hypothetical protein